MNRYSRDYLSSLPLWRLRALDVQEKDEEDLIQEFVNARMKLEPLSDKKIDRSDQPEIKTKEQEEAYQRVIDERVAAEKARIDAGNPKVETPIEPEIIPPVNDLTCSTCGKVSKSRIGAISHLRVHK